MVLYETLERPLLSRALLGAGWIFSCVIAGRAVAFIAIDVLSAGFAHLEPHLCEGCSPVARFIGNSILVTMLCMLSILVRHDPFIHMFINTAGFGYCVAHAL
jgi:hypothetical protein